MPLNQLIFLIQNRFEFCMQQFWWLFRPRFRPFYPTSYNSNNFYLYLNCLNVRKIGCSFRLEVSNYIQWVLFQLIWFLLIWDFGFRSKCSKHRYIDIIIRQPFNRNVLLFSTNTKMSIQFKRQSQKLNDLNDLNDLKGMASHHWTVYCIFCKVCKKQLTVAIKNDIGQYIMYGKLLWQFHGTHFGFAILH